MVYISAWKILLLLLRKIDSFGRINANHTFYLQTNCPKINQIISISLFLVLNILEMQIEGCKYKRAICKKISKEKNENPII